MDRKTIIAIALSIAFLFLYPSIVRLIGLGHYLDPPATQQVAQVDSTAADTAAAPAAGEDASAQAPVPLAGVAPGATPPAAIEAPPIRPAHAAFEKSITVETPLYRAEFSSRGARLLSVALKRYAAGFRGRNGDPVIQPRPGETVPPPERVVLAGAPSFGLDLGSGETRKSLSSLVYAVEESLDAAGDVRALTFTAEDSAGFYVRQTYRVRPDTYALDLEVELRNVPQGLGVSDYSLNTRSWPLFTESDHASEVTSVRASSLVGSNIHREGGAMGGFGCAPGGGGAHPPKRIEGNARWAGVQNRYFLGAVAIEEGTARGVVSVRDNVPLTPDQRSMLPDDAPPDMPVVENALVLGLPSSAVPVNRFVVYFGPIQYDVLSDLGYDFDRAVDLGWRWLEPFSKALLVVLKWLHGVLQNYGVAILVLATLVRVILHPLNMASMKSMRSLQKLQPEIERIRTKYKDNPQGMNTAMMALYKEHKVNPAGGCLPMLLQMPLFIALYSVLFNAIELRQAPFMLWMNDLSAPDHLFSVAGFPIRMLPILMAVSGFVQQKMMPMDPKQAPTMYLMNAVMLVFFYGLPSGLVLYWTVMNVLTIVQQWIMLRQDGTPASSATVVSEPAPAGRGRKGRKAVAKKAAGK